jgi:hypothetical protein
MVGGAAALVPPPDRMTLSSPEFVFELALKGCHWVQVGGDGYAAGDVPFPPLTAIDLVVGMKPDDDFFLDPTTGEVLQPRMPCCHGCGPAPVDLDEHTALLYARDATWRGLYDRS